MRVSARATRAWRSDADFEDRRLRLQVLRFCNIHAKAGTNIWLLSSTLRPKELERGYREPVVLEILGTRRVTTPTCESSSVLLVVGLQDEKLLISSRSAAASAAMSEYNMY